MNVKFSLQLHIYVLVCYDLLHKAMSFDKTAFFSVWGTNRV